MKYHFYRHSAANLPPFPDFEKMRFSKKPKFSNFGEILIIHLMNSTTILL